MITNTPAVHTSTVRPLVSSWLLIVPRLIKCGFGASYITGSCVMPNEPQLSRLIVIAPDSMARPVIRVRSTSAPPAPATGNDGARSPTTAAAASSSTASWSSPTGRTPPVAASHPPRRRSGHARGSCRRLRPHKHKFAWQWLVRRSAPAPASVGRCSLASRSVLPAPAVRTRAGLHLDPGCAPAGSAPVRSRPGSEHAACGRGSRVGGGPGVAFPKSRRFGV